MEMRPSQVIRKPWQLLYQEQFHGLGGVDGRTNQTQTDSASVMRNQLSPRWNSGPGLSGIICTKHRFLGRKIFSSPQILPWKQQCIKICKMERNQRLLHILGVWILELGWNWIKGELKVFETRIQLYPSSNIDKIRKLILS